MEHETQLKEKHEKIMKEKQRREAEAELAAALKAEKAKATKAADAARSRLFQNKLAEEAQVLLAKGHWVRGLAQNTIQASHAEYKQRPRSKLCRDARNNSPTTAGLPLFQCTKNEPTSPPLLPFAARALLQYAVAVHCSNAEGTVDVHSMSDEESFAALPAGELPACR